jgi:hypothetical protein
MAVECHLIRIDKKDFISHDTSMYHLIVKYDVFHSSFHPKWKPFWQTPTLPEYI